MACCCPARGSASKKGDALPNLSAPAHQEVSNGDDSALKPPADVVNNNSHEATDDKTGEASGSGKDDPTNGIQIGPDGSPVEQNLKKNVDVSTKVDGTAVGIEILELEVSDGGDFHTVMSENDQADGTAPRGHLGGANSRAPSTKSFASDGQGNPVSSVTRKLSEGIKKLKRTVSGSGPSQSEVIGNFTIWDSIPKAQMMPTEGSRFKVRNTGYKKSGEKVPSDAALYDCIGCDMVTAEGWRINDVTAKWKPQFPQKKNWKPDWGVPEILVIVAEIPYQSGSLWSAHPATDLGFNVISYHQLSDASIQLLASGKSSTALNHFKALVKKGKSEKSGISFKKIGQLKNIDEVDIPGFLKSYNGKPVLVTASCKFLQHGMPRVLEISYDIREWAYAMRSALGTIFSKLPQSEVEFAYVIEGKTDEELPEQILACSSAKYIDCYALKKVSGKP